MLCFVTGAAVLAQRLNAQHSHNQGTPGTGGTGTANTRHLIEPTPCESSPSRTQYLQRLRSAWAGPAAVHLPPAQPPSKRNGMSPPARRTLVFLHQQCVARHSTSPHLNAAPKCPIASPATRPTPANRANTLLQENPLHPWPQPPIQSGLQMPPKPKNGSNAIAMTSWAVNARQLKSLILWSF